MNNECFCYIKVSKTKIYENLGILYKIFYVVMIERVYQQQYHEILVHVMLRATNQVDRNKLNLYG